MQLRAEQLATHLQKSLLPMYWVSGDEPLLVQESTDLIRTHCRKLDFTEREQFFVESNFDWHNLQQSDSNLSLFAAKKIIELRLRSAKLDENAKSALKNYLTSPNPDNVLLIVSPKIEKATTATKWFQALEKQGAHIQIWPVDTKSLPHWIGDRLLQHGIEADREAVSLLADRVEGNLLAADQEIEKLALLLKGPGFVEGTSITLDSRAVAQMVANSSRYNVFTLVDATLAGDSARAIKVMQGLAADGSEPLMILAMISKEIRNLTQMAVRVEKGQSITAVMESERVWSNRKAVVKAALERLNAATLHRLLQQAMRVDHAVKGLLQTDPWRELSNLVLLMSGTQTAITHRAS